MSTNNHFSNSCPIPGRVDHSDVLSHALADSYCQTPEETLFSTTPGGTKIIYDRKFLLECWNSPVSRTPPCYLPNIPGVTIPTRAADGKLKEMNEVCKEASGKYTVGKFILSF